MSPVAAYFCLFCLSVPSAPYPQVARRDGGIAYTHELLTHGRHLLRLSTTDLILDSDHLRKHRIVAFAKDYATRTCGGAYSLVEEERLTTYTGQVIFKCR